MIYLLQLALSIAAFILSVFLIRFFKINNGVVDWVVLLGCALIPLLLANMISGNKWISAGLVLLNIVLMFSLFFWLTATFFDSAL